MLAKLSDNIYSVKKKIEHKILKNVFSVYKIVNIQWSVSKL